MSQQQWAFRIGDGAGSEVFTQLEGMYECPEWMPQNQVSKRDNTTIDYAASNTTKRKAFNRMSEGQSFSVSVEADPTATAQARLISQAFNDAGVNIQIEFDLDSQTRTYEANALVDYTIKGAEANDENAVDMLTFNFEINSDVTETVV